MVIALALLLEFTYTHRKACLIEQDNAENSQSKNTILYIYIGILIHPIDTQSVTIVDCAIQVCRSKDLTSTPRHNQITDNRGLGDISILKKDKKRKEK